MPGAALDFISGYSVGSQSMMSVDDMGIKSTVYNTSALGWGIGIWVLGVALVITAILSLTRLGSARMGSFGLLMIVFGAIMFVIGGSMYLGIVPMMAYSDSLQCWHVYRRSADGSEWSPDVANPFDDVIAN